jgi:hypothetical protein
MIIYKFRCRKYLKQWNYSLEVGERGKRKAIDRASVIQHNIICDGRGYNHMYSKLLKL